MFKNIFHWDVRKFAVLASLPLAISTVQAIEVTPVTTAEELAELLILPDSGLTLTGAEFVIPDGFDISLFEEMGATPVGAYTNTSGTYGLPGPGIILSSGNVLDYADGGNESSGNSTSYNATASAEQNALLTPITGKTEHFDPVQLNISFDVDDDVDSVSFVAVFGSEEWPEYQNSNFTDGFGLFLNGENIAGVLPADAFEGDPLQPVNIDHPDFQDVPGTELDGVLAPNGVPLLRFDVPVEPGSEGNVFEIILADTGDGSFDTTVFLSSFGDFDSNGGGSEFTPILPDPVNPQDPETGGFVFELPEVIEDEVIWIDPDVATGYVYEASNGGLFASVIAPSLLTVNDPDGYTITYTNSLGDTVTVSLLPGETYTFSDPVSEFMLDGIDTALMLDPTNPLAFVTGLSFAGAGQFGVTQTPITVFVDDDGNIVDEDLVNASEPASFALFGLSIFALLRARRKTA